MTEYELSDEALLKAIQEHLEAEAARDIEWALRTNTDDCLYEFPLQDLEIRGKDKLRSYYRTLFESRPGQTLWSKVRRYWRTGPAGAFAECGICYGTPTGDTETILIGMFEVRDGRVSRERIYVSEHQHWVTDWKKKYGSR